MGLGGLWYGALALLFVILFVVGIINARRDMADASRDMARLFPARARRSLDQEKDWDAIDIAIWEAKLSLFSDVSDDGIEIFGVAMTPPHLYTVPWLIVESADTAVSNSGVVQIEIRTGELQRTKVRLKTRGPTRSAILRRVRNPRPVDG